MQNLGAHQQPSPEMLVEALQAGGRVDDVADRPVLVVIDRADASQEESARVEADPCRESEPARRRVEAVHGRDDV